MPKMRGIFRGRIKNTSGIRILNWLGPLGPTSIEIHPKCNGYLVTPASSLLPLSLYKVVIFTELCYDSRHPLISELLADSSNLAVFYTVGMFGYAQSLIKNTFSISHSPWFRCQSQMYSNWHLGRASCLGRLPWGCSSNRAVWISWQWERIRKMRKEQFLFPQPRLENVQKNVDPESKKNGHLLYLRMFIVYTRTESACVNANANLQRHRYMDGMGVTTAGVEDLAGSESATGSSGCFEKKCLQSSSSTLASSTGNKLPAAFSNWHSSLLFSPALFSLSFILPVSLESWG